MIFVVANDPNGNNLPDAEVSVRRLRATTSSLLNTDQITSSSDDYKLTVSAANEPIVVQLLPGT